MAANKLIHELWEEPDGKTMVCDAGPRGDSARALLEPGARLAWTFEAESHFDAMSQYHARMGWPDYQTSEPWDREPYPPEWITSQRAALAKMMGNRDVIAESASAKAWRAAGEDLGIRFESPFAMHYKNEAYWCAGLLPDFGGPKGTIIACRFAVDDIFDVADALGFYASGLNPYYYESYDRESFCVTLNDWGWFGDPATAPAWFTGALGKHGGRP
jgi:hypothetical protein